MCFSNNDHLDYFQYSAVPNNALNMICSNIPLFIDFEVFPVFYLKFFIVQTLQNWFRTFSFVPPCKNIYSVYVYSYEDNIGVKWNDIVHFESNCQIALKKVWTCLNSHQPWSSVSGSEKGIFMCALIFFILPCCIFLVNLNLTVAGLSLPDIARFTLRFLVRLHGT